MFTRRRERSEIAKGRSSCPKGSAGGRWQFADARAAEAPVDARLALWGGHEVGVVCRDVGVNR